MFLRYFNFIPTFNNPDTIVEMVEKTLLNSKNPLLVVDDGSTQPIEEGLKKSKICAECIVTKRLILRRFDTNQGKGAAIQEAIRWGVKNNFTHMISIDGDGQFNPEEISTLEKKSYESPWSLVFGERTFPDCTPKSSLFGRSFSNFWVYLETGVKLPDTQTGFRCYPLFWVQNFSQSRKKRFSFEIELIVKSMWLGAQTSSVPVRVEYPEDRVSHFKKIKDNFLLSVVHTELCCKRFFSFFGSYKNSWTGRQGRGETLGVKIFSIIISKAGLRPAYLLLYFVILFYFVFNFRARRSLNSFWCLIDSELSFFTRQKRVYMTMYKFGQNLIDYYFVRSSKITQEAILEKFTHIKIKESILVSGHFASHNIAAFLFVKLFKRNIQTLQYVHDTKNFEETTFSSQENKNASKEKKGQTFYMYESLQRGEVVSGLIDRPVNERFELVKFLDRLIPIDVGFALVAKAMKSKVLFFTFKKITISEYEFISQSSMVEIDKKGPETLFLWAKDFAEFYEKEVKNSPYLWANFYTLWQTYPLDAMPNDLRKKQKLNPEIN